jgi:preprotein translocase subunit SecG
VTTFVVVLHVLFATFLVLFILLHRGTGGGLSDMFGGGGGSLGGSVVVEKNLDRLTVGAAIGMIITSILLVRWL